MNKPESRFISHDISTYLSSRGISSDIYNFDGTAPDKNPFEQFDFAVTLGGDGTVLFAARCCASLGIPVFPVNLGEFGFIASIEKAEWKNLLDDFLDGKLSESSRSLLEVSAFHENDENDNVFFESVALNDVVISASSFAEGVILLDVFYNDIPLGLFKADGVIISTATGSTAYSASSGGPIIDPDLDAFVLTPINAFSLSVRPLVLNHNGEVCIKIMPVRRTSINQANAIVTVDGQKPIHVSAGDTVKIKCAKNKVRLAGCTSQKFYNALRSKLNWSGGPHAGNSVN